MKKVVCLCSMVVLGTIPFTNTNVIYACTTVASCQDEIKRATQERQKLQSEIDSTKSQADALITEVQNLKVQVATYNAQINAASQTIELLDEESKQLQQSMEETEDILRDRLIQMQLMYETNQDINFIAESNSITEMLERSQAVSDLTESDQKLVKRYDVQYKQVIENKQKTETTKKELEGYKEEQEKLIQANTVKIEEFKDAQAKLEAEESAVRDEQALSASELQKIQDELKRIPPTPPTPAPQAPSSQTTGGSQTTKPNGSQGGTSSNTTSPVSPSGVVYPLKSAILTSHYGEKEWHTIPHNGTDYAPRGDATLYSMVDGVVVANKYNSARGWLVAIAFNDGQGLKTLLYQHMAGASPVGIGGRVSKGQVVGVAGNSGYSFGVHLHVEVGDAGPNGKWIDRGAAAGPGLYPTENYFRLPYSW